MITYQNKNIMEQLKNKLEEVRCIIVNDLSNSSDDSIFTTLLDAYNRYQVDENDSADYIFNTDNKDDIICCLNKGLSIDDLHTLINFRNNVNKCYYMFGYNYKVMNKDEVKDIIFHVLGEIIKKVLTYPYVKEYRVIYNNYITNILLK